MEEIVRKELDTYLMMVNNWRNSYASWLEVPGGNDYVVEDLKEDISTYIAPKLQRFVNNEYITPAEVKQFWYELVKIVDDFAEVVRKFDGGENV